MPLLGELSERARVLAREHVATFRTDLKATGIIQVDRSRIGQAVLILVDNAAKYSPMGEAVTLRSLSHGQEIIIEVADKGPGIPEEDLSLIFERFYRADKARTRKQGGAGIGLGLAIAKSIVEAHGGRIEVQSIPHQGTTMRIFLPVAAVSQPTPQLASILTMRETAKP